MEATLAASRAILLKRQGLVFVEPGAGSSPDEFVTAVEVKLAKLGYVLATGLRARLARLAVDDLTDLQKWIWEVLASKSGAGRKHRPLFRRFPHDIPDDTRDLWIRRVLTHYLQGEDQPCLFCGHVGTTHVLNPCSHVVCGHCFDGGNYSACPVCEHHIDPSSPFIKPSPERGHPAETIRFKRLDLGEDLEAALRALFDGFCGREQALSTDDKEDFEGLLRDLGDQAIAWLPDSIPLKENRAAIFGSLFRHCDPRTVFPAAAEHMATATDVLRLIAAFSGADPALQGQTVLKQIDVPVDPMPVSSPRLRRMLRRAAPPETMPVWVNRRVDRFKIAPMRRPLRRALLELLDSMPPDSLTEDMLRHRSYWVWVGEFLHPHEYRNRFRNICRAFSIVRKKAPDGTPAPAFQGFYAKLESAVSRRDVSAATELLLQRPGELARRFDHALRVAGDDMSAARRVLDAFTSSIGQFSTPVLLTLGGHLPARTRKANVRIFWPKGPVSKGVSSPDGRAVLAAEIVDPAVRAVDAELLRRFAEKPGFGDCIIDAALKNVIAPFNERTASPSAVSLPRGSRIEVPQGKVIRLFLHWCQPQTDGHATDLDLSIGFYDSSWTHIGVCSYYNLKLTGAGADDVVAVSSGDLRDAPFPDGATEFVDLHRERALESKFRYAVMVVNSYAGLPFGQLERGFAGFMARDDVDGKHFDPRTVELKFDLQGESGIYLPLVLDIERNTLHWLDTYSTGELIFNNVENANAAICKICPEMMDYFGSGVRTSMYDLALLHAAARARRVYVRGNDTALFERKTGEDPSTFLERLRGGKADDSDAAFPGTDAESPFAVLYRGDIDLPEDSVRYVLFQDRMTGTISAGDLIS